MPKYACPDLVSQSGFWAKALPEELSNEGNVISFWVDKKGRVFYRINDSSPMLFFSGVQVPEPLWALIDIYGLTRGVQLLGESCKKKNSYWSFLLSEKDIKEIFTSSCILLLGMAMSVCQLSRLEYLSDLKRQHQTSACGHDDACRSLTELSLVIIMLNH